MSIDPVFNIPLSVIHASSALACATLFYCYFRIPERGLGLKMIIVLAISDFIFHIAQIVGVFCDGIILGYIVSSFSEAAFNFSLFWACNIAYFTYRFIHMTNINNPQKYLGVTLISFAVLSICITIIGTVLGGVLVWNLIADFPGPLAMVCTCFLNLKSISSLKKATAEWGLSAQTTIKVLYRYAFIQVLTVGPVAVYFLVVDISQLPLTTFGDVAQFLLAFAGLANTVVYFFQRSHLSGNSQERGHRGSELSSMSSFADKPPMSKLES